MYIPHREPPAQWLEDVARIAPVLDTVSHLTIHWHAGMPDAPVGRWIVFECVPREAARVFGLLDELAVRFEVDELEARERHQAYTPDPLLVWAQHYLDTRGFLPSPVWVVQGPGGGHPFKYTPAESVLARAGLLPATVPAIGDLPYADCDWRVWDALKKRSVLNARIKDEYTARELVREAAVRRAREATVRATEEAMGVVMETALPDVLAASVPIALEDAAGTAARVDDEHLARYIETGDISLTS